MTRDQLVCAVLSARLRSAQNVAMSSATSDGATAVGHNNGKKTCASPNATQKSHFISSMGAAVRRFMRNQANTPLIPNGRNYSVGVVRSEAVRIASLAFCFSCRAKHTFEELFSTPLIGSTEADTAFLAAEHQKLAAKLRQELDVVHRSTFALMSAAENIGVEVSFTVNNPNITDFEEYNYHPLPPNSSRVIGSLLDVYGDVALDPEAYNYNPLPPSPNRAVGNFPNVHGENLPEAHGETEGLD